MHLPPLSSLPSRHHNSCEDISGGFLSGGVLSGGIHGQVTLHPSVTLAPTALLQAEPGSQLRLAAGVCVGAGAILHAHGGTLEIESGATLGSAVLLIGRGKVGANACIGSMVTIVNPAIAPGAVVTAGTLLGDASRSVDPSPEQISGAEPSPPNLSNSSAANPQPVTSDQNDAGLNHGAESNGKVKAHTPDSPDSPDSQEGRGTQLVTGKAALNELMTALFPHRQHFDQP